MKILIQLEIEYLDTKNMYDYKKLISEIKDYYENVLPIPETNKLKFKSLGAVKISRVIQ